jgi:hypothetical protein
VPRSQCGCLGPEHNKDERLRASTTPEHNVISGLVLQWDYKITVTVGAPVKVFVAEVNTKRMREGMMMRVETKEMPK